jgi:hypothetical protein
VLKFFSDLLYSMFMVNDKMQINRRYWLAKCFHKKNAETRQVSAFQKLLKIKAYSIISFFLTENPSLLIKVTT